MLPVSPPERQSERAGAMPMSSRAGFQKPTKVPVVGAQKK